MRPLKILVTALLLLSFSTPLAIAVPGVVTMAIPCQWSGYSINIYMPVGVESFRLTNDNNCHNFGFSPIAQITYGAGSTWTYAAVNSGVGTSGSYTQFDGFISTGPLDYGDSYTLTDHSSTAASVMFYDGSSFPNIIVFFNQPQLDEISGPLTIGQSITLTGENLNNLDNLDFQGNNDPYDNFQIIPTSQSSSSVTFTIPTSYLSYYDPQNLSVTPGEFSITPYAAPAPGSGSQHGLAQTVQLAPAQQNSEPVEFPYTIQESTITSVVEHHDSSSTVGTIYLIGDFKEHITNVEVNGINVPFGSWIVKSHSLELTSSSLVAGTNRIRVFNGSMPLLPILSFESTALA